MRDQNGFTLIEVLLSLAILSLVLLAGQTIVSSTAAARNRLQAACDAAASAQSIEWLLREDLHGVARSDETAGTFQAASPADANGEEFLSFVSVSNPLPRRGAGLFQVAYRASPDPNDPAALDLYRSQAPWLSEETEKPPWEPVFRKLSSIRVECFDGSQWHAEWPAGETDFPVAARFTLGIRSPDGGGTETHTLVIWIPAGAQEPRAAP